MTFACLGAAVHLKDSELVTNVVQLMVLLTTRVGRLRGFPNGQLRLFEHQVSMELKSWSTCSICRTFAEFEKLGSILHVLLAQGLQGRLLQVRSLYHLGAASSGCPGPRGLHTEKSLCYQSVIIM